MINKIFFERFTTEELEQLNAYIQKVCNDRENLHSSYISESGVSIRCKILLKELSVETWEQLICYSEEDLQRLKNIGTKTLKEIFIELEKRGIKLK